MGQRSIPRWFHVLAAAWIVGALAASRLAPDAYYGAMQEDRAVEWLTVACFLAAAGLGGWRGMRARRVGDLLVALFCVVAAGEEISWGQRLLGYTPPDLFLARNVQQEANLHNLAEAFGQPKWTLIAILAAYGIVAPLATRYVPGVRRLAERLGFTSPPVGVMPLFAVTIGILVLYPVRFTGEWAEALAGALFVAALAPRPRVLGVVLAASALAAVAMEGMSAWLAAPNPHAVACARAETAAIADAVAADTRLALRPRTRTHRRLWSLVQDRDIGDGVLAAIGSATCAGERADDQSRRRAFGVDPWGTAYWVRVTPRPAGRRIEVYSFGADRRRDPAAGDDIAAIRD
ncbi:MAG TPA: hypothetical protein VFT96_12100 [Gemmatimonadaceae bacterium]|nr:hypothetical protein [Gemmatimonadaceae bacterium]